MSDDTSTFTVPSSPGELTRTDAIRIEAPPKPNWEWCFGGDWRSFAVHIHTDSPPNWFHRLMLRGFVGIHWRAIK